MDLQVIGVAGAALGGASHLGYFIDGEHHKNGPKYVISALTIPAFLFLGFVRTLGQNAIVEAARATSVAVLSYAGALFLSMAIYRVFFHRLRNFPGPLPLKVTKFAHLYNLMKEEHGPRDFEFRDKLHKEFGEFVRIGPNELSISAPESLVKILGPGSKCSKGEYYDDIAVGSVSLHYVRSKELHGLRRKIWDRAFNSKALRGYEGRMLKYADQLMEQFRSHKGKPINAADWFAFYSFDIMGDMAFGAPYDMLLDGKPNPMATIVQQGSVILGPLGPIPWLLPILNAIPGAAKSIKVWVRSNISKYEPESPDLFTYLLEAEKIGSHPIHKDPKWLVGDSTLVIGAGTDTTTITFSYLFYYLCRYPEIQEKVYQELKEYYHPGTEAEFRDLANAPYLNGVIMEVLRLNPPVPGGILRKTPSEGITVGDTFIPGGVTVSAPLWTVGRLESCYEKPTEFIPERWSSKPEMIRNKNAFASFSLGPMACVGRQFAMMELRNLTSRILSEFKVNFAPGEDGHAIMHEWHESFTMHVDSLMLQFKQRDEVFAN
ncbi:hypothetical protein HYFRA_00001242 [Hymenoscyphus fraxineus]|uniref:Cytochrome P450 n=1 Tax=Hymenoscyphus fraxineus TaxID=746836 RepID=A0A9N9KQY9_9HELO|nr:hypothetical protein HYFRA_00001242 [Hymenoscyphus fraxineus]